MNRYYKQQALHSNMHQQSVRAEISRQVDDFLKKGGKIEQLSGPQFQPHRSVRINSAVLTDVL